MKNNKFDSLENLGVLANILQVMNYMQNTEQTTNDGIMKALNLQNEKYLKYIIEQNQIIIDLLKGEKNDKY